MTERSLKSILFDRIIGIVTLLLSIFIFVIFALILITLFYRGIKVINWSFLTGTPQSLLSGKPSGILNAIIGTLMILGTALVISLPFGVITGVYLFEYRMTRMARYIYWCIDILAGLPFLVFGIIGYIWVVLPMRHLGYSFSVLAGGISLSIILFSIVASSVERGLGTLPPLLKESLMAVGMPYYKAILFMLISGAVRSISAGILGGLARVAGLTSPLIFTVFGNDRIHVNLLKPAESLPIVVYNFTENSDFAFGAALLLVIGIFIISLIGGILGRK